MVNPNISSALAELYPTARPGVDWIVADDGSGPYLAWLNPALGPMPDAASLAVAGAVADRKRLLERIGSRRWEVETGGVLVAGMPVATDDRSKFLLNAAADKAAADPGYLAEWKAAPGVWVSLNAAQLAGLKAAVFDHVTACFAREKALTELLLATADADLPAFAQTIEAFWPVAE